MKKLIPYYVLGFFFILIYAVSRIIIGTQQPQPSENSNGRFEVVTMTNMPAPLKNFGPQPYSIPLRDQGVTFTVVFEQVGGSVVVTTDPNLQETIAVEVLDLSTGGEYIPGLAEPGKPFRFEKNGAGAVVFYVRALDNSDTQFWVELVVTQIQP